MWYIALLVLYPMATELLNLHWLFYVTHSCFAIQVSSYTGWWSLIKTKIYRAQISDFIELTVLSEDPPFLLINWNNIFGYDSWWVFLFFFFFETCNAYFSVRPRRMLTRFICSVSLAVCPPLILWDTSNFMLQEMRTTESCRSHECKNCLEGMEQFSPNYSQLESALFAVILR